VQTSSGGAVDQLKRRRLRRLHMRASVEAH